MTPNSIIEGFVRRRDVLRGFGAVGVLGAAGCQTIANAGPVGANEAGVEAAFLYAYPLYEIARTGQNRAQMPGLNKVSARGAVRSHSAVDNRSEQRHSVFVCAAGAFRWSG